MLVMLHNISDIYVNRRRNIFPNIFLYNNMHNYHDLPLHSIILSTGSDSHSPFPVHVAVLGPMITCPVGQLKLTDAPSNDGST